MHYCTAWQSRSRHPIGGKTQGIWHAPTAMQPAGPLRTAANAIDAPIPFYEMFIAESSILQRRPRCPERQHGSRLSDPLGDHEAFVSQTLYYAMHAEKMFVCCRDPVGTQVVDEADVHELIHGAAPHAEPREVHHVCKAFSMIVAGLETISL